MSSPSIYLALPDWSLFKFPPDPIPPALPPPHDESTFQSPFAIPYDVFNGALDVRVPFTIGTIYVISVALVNAYNRSNGNKPWWFANTRVFKQFVILHNILLAVYSGITFIAMTRAMNRVWPGFDNPNGLAGVADALCKMHGPRGLGDAVTYNPSKSVWEVKNTIIQLLPEGTPDPTDVGRLWNEGLAFWGWFFYLSKFYEVVDTFIIVAKGKRSATLQTYHHAGAMLCMWAGIRYMSPPIWMFVWINSAIHTMMYTYFTLSALNIRVPMLVKRTLTTMQITQFLFGATFAATHLFIKYDIPVATAYKIVHPVASMLSAASSTVSEVASTATAVVATPAAYGALLKRFLLRAAGEEGVAENVRDPVTGHALLKGAEEAVQRYHEETRWRNEYTTVSCVDTTGQSFAIWLNLVYLAPLTALFIRFFVRAYTSRGRAKGHKQSRAYKADHASIEAAKGTNRKVDEIGKKTEKGINKVAAEPAGKAKSAIKDLSEEVKRDLQAMKDKHAGKVTTAKDKANDAATTAKDQISKQAKAAKDAAPSKDDLTKQAKAATNAAKDAANSGKEEITKQAKAAKDAADDSTATNNVKDAATNSVDEITKEAKAIKKEVEAELNEDSPSADDDNQRPGTADSGNSSSPATPSGKKNKKRNKNKNKNVEASAETAKVKEGESFADAVKE